MKMRRLFPALIIFTLSAMALAQVSIPPQDDQNDPDDPNPPWALPLSIVNFDLSGIGCHELTANRNDLTWAQRPFRQGCLRWRTMDARLPSRRALIRGAICRRMAFGKKCDLDSPKRINKLDFPLLMTVKK